LSQLLDTSERRRIEVGLSRRPQFRLAKHCLPFLFRTFRQAADALAAKEIELQDSQAEARAAGQQLRGAAQTAVLCAQLQEQLAQVSDKLAQEVAAHNQTRLALEHVRLASLRDSKQRGRGVDSPVKAGPGREVYELENALQSSQQRARELEQELSRLQHHAQRQEVSGRALQSKTESFRAQCEQLEAEKRESFALKGQLKAYVNALHTHIEGLEKQMREQGLRVPAKPALVLA